MCEDADYGRDWYRYNYYPWWNRSDPYFYGSYNSYGWDETCPAYYYYDYSCGACRYYSGYEGPRNSWWWNSPSASGRPAVGTGTAHPRRSRSSGVQANPGTSGMPLNKSSSVQSGGSASGGASHQQRSRTVEIIGTPQDGSNSQPPAIQELPKQQVEDEQRPVEQPRARDVQPAPDQPPVQQQPAQSSPPPSQSPNNGNNNPPDQNQNSDGGRRNPRSF